MRKIGVSARSDKPTQNPSSGVDECNCDITPVIGNQLVPSAFHSVMNAGKKSLVHADEAQIIVVRNAALRRRNWNLIQCCRELRSRESINLNVNASAPEVRPAPTPASKFTHLLL